MPDEEPQRIQKVLAHAGVASRRAVEEMIEQGRVRVNGTKARLGQRIDPAKDVVEVNGSQVPLQHDLRYLLLNKPVGVVTTADDPEGRETVLDLIESDERLWPVGRLDIETEGAVLLTNDGELTHRLTHPSFEVPKTYLAEVRGSAGNKVIKALLGGVELDDGPARAKSARIVESARGDTLLELVLTEGRNREIRRMLDALGFTVVGLVRVAIGPLRLGRLKAGTYRKLVPAEVMALYRAAGM
ncbi:MAG: rRNA synthase [Actinomycetota bacterium]|nr:rRNA synthase [Actinomycetota bacterium]